MGTPNSLSLPLSVQASLLLRELRANPMASTSLRPPFDDRDYVPSVRLRPVGSAFPETTSKAGAAHDQAA